MAKKGEVVEPSEIQKVPEAGLSQLDQATVDVQVATAKRYPRSIGKFKETAMAMATNDVQTAEQCTYRLPRAGKTISGPSVRIAELCLSAWGNTRISARVTGEDEKYVYSEACAWDLETNVAVQRTIRRRITDKHGNRYKDDMVVTTANAASSIAKREAIFDVIPRAFVKEIQAAAQKVIAGDTETFPKRREEVVAGLMEMGVDKKRVLRAIRKDRVADITVEDFVNLTGFKTAIKDGDLSIESVFPLEENGNGPQGADALANKLAGGNNPPSENEGVEVASSNADSGDLKEPEQQAASAPSTTAPPANSEPVLPGCPF